MSSAKPTLLLVHGAWHTPECFSGIQPKLESLSYPIATVQLPSSGGPPSTTWKDDVKAILDVALPLMDEGKEVVIICHSYGGIPGIASTQGQSIEERAKLGKKGGFKAILFIAAFAIPVRGMTLKQTFGGVYPPWFTEKDGMAVPGPGAKEAFYSGANDEEAEAMLKKCNNHTMAAFETPVDFVASDLTISRTYMICETDQIMVLPFQEQLVAAVPGMKSQRCTAGHSPFLTMPDRTVEVIVSVADE